MTIWVQILYSMTTSENTRLNNLNLIHIEPDYNSEIFSSEQSTMVVLWTLLAKHKANTPWQCHQPKSYKTRIRLMQLNNVAFLARVHILTLCDCRTHFRWGFMNDLYWRQMSRQPMRRSSTSQPPTVVAVIRTTCGACAKDCSERHACRGKAVTGLLLPLVPHTAG